MSELRESGNGRFRRPVYDNRISLGSIISAGVVLVAIVAAFYESKGDTRANAQDIENLDKRVVKVENRVDLGDLPAFKRRAR